MSPTILQPGTHSFEITTPGEHIFDVSNISGSFTFTITTAHAHIYLYGVFCDDTTFDHNLSIVIYHNAPHTKSDVTIKSVLDHGSQFRFTGLMHISSEAVHAEAKMLNHNLMLDKKSHALSIPQLEVRPSIATCTHRSVTTPPEPSLIAYLGTKGIAPNHAKKLLINGFLSDTPYHRISTDT